MTAGTTLNINGTSYNFDASGVCQNANGVSAQTPAAGNQSSGGGVTGENGGPGVSKLLAVPAHLVQVPAAPEPPAPAVLPAAALWKPDAQMDQADKRNPIWKHVTRTS